ncbi:MAG TPA: folylpolyglutamate synthase/dihydrofolate synthase family protein, partial [Bacillota bacterium]|nr:folylpolyglutamate synthase/dihydrofolate synthase family protein [Bacillota bacterium]
MNYDETMEYLGALARFGVKPGLERTDALLNFAGQPQQRMKHVHIAGTNGKGSVAVMIESVLRAAGFRTGLYTSPHLQRYTERIRVCGQEIPGRELAALITSLAPAVQRLAGDPSIGAPTEFEVATAACFQWFASQEVEIAVVEVGLGGRYDSTNVITPEVSVITHIAMDHMDKLGNTLGEIASDKAGIIKPGVSVVVGPQEPEVTRVLEDAARRAGAPLTLLGRDVGFDVVSIDMNGTTIDMDLPSFGPVRATTGLVGRHQASNCATAAAALGVLAGARKTSACVFVDDLRRGLAQAANPGRFEVVASAPFVVILDGAHNPDGARALAATVERVLPGTGPRVLVVASSRDKRVDEMMQALAPCFDVVVATAAAHTRSGAADPEALAAAARAVWEAGALRRRAGSGLGPGTIAEPGPEAYVKTPAHDAVQLGLAIARQRQA